MIVGLQFDKGNCIKCSYENNQIIEHEIFSLEKPWEYYVKKELNHSSNPSSHSIGVLFDKVEKEQVEKLDELRRMFHVSQKGLRLFTKEEAFLGLMEQDSTWLEKGNAGLFDYTKEGLSYYYIWKSGTKLAVSKTDVSKYMELSNRPEEKDIPFMEAVKGVLAKGVTSVIYLCGDGFQGNWMKESTNVLCNGRKVFFGNHVFVRGIIGEFLVARDKEERRESLIMTSNGTKHNIYIEVHQDGHVKAYPLLKEGSTWMTSKNQVVIIGKKLSCVQIQVESALSKEKGIVKVPLSNNKKEAGKFRVEAEYINEKQCRVRVYDLGLGNLIPRTYQVYQRIFALDEVVNADE